MELKIKTTVYQSICDICGITVKKYNKIHKTDYFGFGTSVYKIMGKINECPDCRAKENQDIANKIINLLIVIRRERKLLRRFD